MHNGESLPVPLGLSDRVQAFLESQVPNGPATLPVPNSTRPFWLHPSSKVNPLAKVGSDGPLSDDADICIIGSGITGVSAAYHLSKAVAGSTDTQSMKVVVLEARDFCSGATGRNGGHLTPSCFHDFQRNVHLYGKEQALKQLLLENHTATALVQVLKSHDLADSVDLVAGGNNHLFYSEEEQENAMADYDLAKQSGADMDGVEWYDAAYMLKTYGAEYPAVRRPGHNLWPMKLVTALYRLADGVSQSCERFSLRLHTNTPVTSIAPSVAPGRRWHVQTPRGVVSCTAVLHATNAYASHLLPHMAGPGGVVPTRGQIIATRARVSADVLTRAGWGGNADFEYWFPRPAKSEDDRAHPLVILGGGREVAKAFELYETDDGVLNEEVSDVIHRFLPAVFPGKFDEEDEPEWEWTGIMGFTKLTDPFVGPVIDRSSTQTDQYKGQYLSVGYTGHGMPRAYACAEAVTHLLLHELRGEPRETWIPPDWLPAHYLTWLREVTGTA